MIALASWVLTLAFVAFALRAHRRLVLVARACHELRSPLFAMQLGLHGLGGEPSRLLAIELELARAGRALDDLAAAPSGARARSHLELVDVAELIASHAPSWTTLTSAHGANLDLAGVTRPSRAATLAERPGAAPAPPRPAAVAAACPSPSPRPAVAKARPSPRPAATAVRPAAAPVVLADPLRLAQALANLVANAAEHGGTVVSVRVDAEGGWVRVEVIDDGPGLPATRPGFARHGPRGHGLAIATSIAGDHGGRVFAAPCDAGARVVFELPAARAPV